LKIFITGASGFVGGAVVAALKGQHEITAMSRSPASDKKIEALGVEPVRCALGAAPKEALAGVEAVIHCAAFVEEWGTWREFWEGNVEGTKQILKVAREAGVKRFIHIGTEAALFHGQDMIDVDETYPLALNSPFPYSRTKAHAEKAVREANAQGFTTIVIRPRMVWGPGDQTILPAIIGMIKKGSFAWIDGGKAKTSTTYIGNLVHGIAQALTKGKGGAVYFVLDDGGPVVFKEFAMWMLACAGVTAPTRTVPGALIRTIAFIGEKAYRILPFLPGRPMITRFTANVMSRDCVLIDKKARSDLEYRPPVSIDAGMKALALSLKG
jgi:nucleoside-diphosphate-sugar epimerase